MALLLLTPTPAGAADIDTSQWAAHAGQPATAQSTGIAELTGSGLVHVNEADGNSSFIQAPSGNGVAFSVRPAAAPVGDVQRIWFSMRLKRAAGATFPGNPSFWLHAVQGGTLRTTAYIRDDDAASVPNGTYAKALGMSIHSQSNLTSGQDVILVGCEWNNAMPVISWGKWTQIEIELVRGLQGRYVVSVNGTPVGGRVGVNTTGFTPGQIAASMRIVLPPMAGLQYELGGPIGYSDSERTYARSGATFAPGASLYRLLSVPGALAAPWSPFSTSGTGVVYSVDSFAASGIVPDHRRVIMSGQAGGTGAITSTALGEVTADRSGWSTVVMREVLVTPGATATVRVEQPGASPLQLAIHDGTLWIGNQPVVPWNHGRRYAVCLHMHVASNNGERAVTLVDLSADTLNEQIVFSADLPALGSAISELGELTFSGSFTQGPGAIELGGIAVCRRLDVLMVDSYVAAFTFVPPPRLVALSRAGRVFFSGCDVDLVPGRPLRVSEPAEGPMLLFPVGRSGNRLSSFLAQSGAVAASCRGFRWILDCGFVNDLSDVQGDPFWVDSPAHAAARASAVTSALSAFILAAAEAESEVVIGTAIATPTLSANTNKTLAFQEYNQRVRGLSTQHQGSGVLTVADVDATLSAAAKAALFSSDGTHFSAAGDITYAQAIIDSLVSSERGPPVLDWFTVDCGSSILTLGTMSLEGTIGQPDACDPTAPLTAFTAEGTFSLVGGYISDFSAPPCFHIEAQNANVNICSPGQATFSVAASGAGPFTYQWRKDGTPVNPTANPSAATSTLTITQAHHSDAGVYDCTVSDACGSRTCESVRLYVDAADLGVQGGFAGHDGSHDNNDFVLFVEMFFSHNPAADLGKQGGYLGSDGSFDNNDFVVFVDLFFAAC